MRPVICLVTDRARFGGIDGVVAHVAAAARAGVDLVQVRERDLEGRALQDLVVACLGAVDGTATRILVNDRLDIARAAGAHGVHLRADSPPAGRLRPQVPAGFLIGRSVHGVEEAVHVAREGGLDYLVFGTIFDTLSKPGQKAAGTTALRAAATRVGLPVLAIGGITLERLPAVAAAGASGFAAIGMFAGEAADSGVRLQLIVRQAALAFDTLRHVS
jgi:thiamine-phosphate diphosphorylase